MEFLCEPVPHRLTPKNPNHLWYRVHADSINPKEALISIGVEGCPQVNVACKPGRALLKAVNAIVILGGLSRVRTHSRPLRIRVEDGGKAVGPGLVLDQFYVIASTTGGVSCAGPGETNLRQVASMGRFALIWRIWPKPRTAVTSPGITTLHLRGPRHGRLSCTGVRPTFPGSARRIPSFLPRRPGAKAIAVHSLQREAIRHDHAGRTVITPPIHGPRWVCDWHTKSA